MVSSRDNLGGDIVAFESVSLSLLTLFHWIAQFTITSNYPECKRLPCCCPLEELAANANLSFANQSAHKSRVINVI